MSPYSKRTHSIIGIDPGRNLGVSILHVDDDFNILDFEPVTYYVEKHVPQKGMHLETKKALEFEFMFDTISNLVQTTKPIAIARENAFVNKKFPHAAISLSKVLGVLELAIKKAKTKQPIFRMAPKQVKFGIGAGGKADKDDMVKALMNIEDMRELVKSKEDLLDEHNVDATAMAYVALESIRKNPSLLLAMSE